MIDNQEEQSAKQYVDLYSKLTDLIVKNNPNKITCKACGQQFWIYSIGSEQENDLVREFYKNSNISDVSMWAGAHYCPCCGIKLPSLGTPITDDECVDNRARNRRR